MYELRPKKVPTDTFRAGRFPLFICAVKACIDRCHKGFTEEEIQKFPEYNTMPPPTEEQLKRLPDPHYKSFSIRNSGKGKQRLLCKVDAQRRAAFELATATDRTHYNLLLRSLSPKAGMSLYAKGVGKSSSNDISIRKKIQRHLGVPMDQITNLVGRQGDGTYIVDKPDGIFTRCCKDENGTPIPCPLCKEHLLDNMGFHQEKCKKIDRSISHNNACRASKDLIQNQMQIPIAVTLEQANLMTADAPEAEQNHRGDLTIHNLQGHTYVIDISTVSDKLQGNNIANMSQQIRARELEKINKYRNLRPEFTFLPVVYGTNGSLGKGAQKFFSLLCKEMVSYGRIPAWYFWSNILPVSNLDRGAHDLHLCWDRKRLNSQNPASIRLFDRTTRLGLEGSNRVSYSGTRPQNRL